MLVSLWGTFAAGARVDRARAVNVSACVNIRTYVLLSAVRGTNYELPVFLLTLRIGLRGKEHTYVRTVNVSVVYT